MRHPGWLHENREWIRKHVLDHPDASVDDIARAANNARRGVPRGMVGDIRREALSAIETGGVKPLVVVRPRQPFDAPVTVKPRPPFNPPRIAAVAFGPPPKTDESESEPAAEETPPVKGKRFHPETMEARKKFADDYLLANPGTTFPKVRDAVIKHFGHGMPAEYIMAALRAVRETTGILPKRARNRASYVLSAPSPAPTAVVAAPAAPPAAAPPGDAEVAAVARQLLPYMRAHGLSKVSLEVEIDVEGNASADWALERMEKTQGKASL